MDWTVGIDRAKWLSSLTAGIGERAKPPNPEMASLKAASTVLAGADELEEFYVSTTGMKPDFLQLSSGRINFFLRTVAFDGVVLVWVHSDGRQLWRDVMVRESLHFGYCVRSAGPVRSLGHDIAAGDAMLWQPGVELDYNLTGPVLTLELAVVPSIVDQLGWEFRGPPIQHVGSDRLRRLTKICHQATSDIFRSQSGQGATSDGGQHNSHWRDSILDALEDALQPWMIESEHFAQGVLTGTRHYKLFRDVEQAIGDDPDAVDLNIDALAERLGIARRTVFHAFRQHLGVGPYRYFELRRLHTLRKHLSHSNPQRDTITRIASSLGFADLGRLAGKYHQLFGEYPRDTLRRPPR